MTRRTQEKVSYIIILAVIALALVAGAVGGLYALTGLAEGNLLRWVTVIAVLALPASILATWRIATHAAREHLAGFDRGIDGGERLITSLGRALSASASMARATKATALPAQSFDDLLPRPGSMKIIDATSNERQLIKM